MSNSEYQTPAITAEVARLNNLAGLHTQAITALVQFIGSNLPATQSQLESLMRNLAINNDQIQKRFDLDLLSGMGTGFVTAYRAGSPFERETLLSSLPKVPETSLGREELLRRCVSHFLNMVDGDYKFANSLPRVGGVPELEAALNAGTLALRDGGVYTHDDGIELLAIPYHSNGRFATRLLLFRLENGTPTLENRIYVEPENAWVVDHELTFIDNTAWEWIVSTGRPLGDAVFSLRVQERGHIQRIAEEMAGTSSQTFGDLHVSVDESGETSYSYDDVPFGELPLESRVLALGEAVKLIDSAIAAEDVVAEDVVTEDAPVDEATE